VDSIFLDFTLPNSATWFYFSFLLAIALFFQFTRLLSLRNIDLIALYLFVPGFLLIQEASQLELIVHPDWERAATQRFYGYVWLLSASAYWVIRCLFDLAVIRRPLLRPNLNLFGLAWFGVALFLCLTAVSVRRPADPWPTVGKEPAAISGVRDGAAAVVSQAKGPFNPHTAAQVRFWVERSLAILCHLAVVLGLLLVGIFHFREADTGVATGTLYLLLPFTAFHFGQIHHVLPSALIVWAVFAFRKPQISGLLLGLAAGMSFFPMLLLPVWLHFYWKRGANRFAGGFFLAAAIGLAVTLAVLYAAGLVPHGLSRTLSLPDWQPWKEPHSEGVWSAVHWAYRLPVFIVFAVFTVFTFFWPPVRNLGDLLALSAAILIGVQFWFADRGGLYVLWYAPLLLLMVFRPSTADLQPLSEAPGRNSGLWVVRRLLGRQTEHHSTPMTSPIAG
jgi:hypothetical protein